MRRLPCFRTDAHLAKEDPASLGRHM